MGGDAELPNIDSGRCRQREVGLSVRNDARMALMALLDIAKTGSCDQLHLPESRATAVFCATDLKRDVAPRWRSVPREVISPIA
jgi:hypothetical protein